MGLKSCSGILPLNPSLREPALSASDVSVLPSITLLGQQVPDPSPFPEEAHSSSAVPFSPCRLKQAHLNLLSVAGAGGCVPSGT